jgi:mono/diheme cytochrome c family protein
MARQTQLERLDVWRGMALRPAAGAGGGLMRTRTTILLSLLTLTTVVWAASSSPKGNNVGTPVARSQEDAEALRIEGERRFRANCGRCHAAPHKFPPRMMATIVRHMRVRATITEQDMRLVLYYMSQ